MLTQQELEEKLGQVFTPEQAATLVEALNPIGQLEKQRAADTRELKQALVTLTEETGKLVEAQARTEQRMGSLETALERLAEAQARTEQRMGSLETALERLAEAQAQTEQQVSALTSVLKQTNERTAKLIGWQFEYNYRVKAHAYFGAILRRVQVTPLSEIEEEIQRHLSDQEISDLLPLALLVRGRPRHQPGAPEVWLAVEISALVDRSDVEQSQRRANLLRRAGYRAIPTVAGENVTADAESVAQAEHVLLLQDGRHQFWAEALQAALAS